MSPLVVVGLLMVAGDMPQPPGPQLQQPAESGGTVRVHCQPEKNVCLIVMDDLAALLASNNANFDRAEKAEADAQKLREIKGCAKVEVKVPGFKKERDL